jgi:parallel beta-helix repeat protein
VDNTTLKLARTRADALALTPVPIDLDATVATGDAHSVAAEGIDLEATLASGSGHRLDFDIRFDPSLGVSTAADTVKFVEEHEFVTGQAVTYRNGGGMDVGGLMDGTTYYVIKVDSVTIQLAASQADALAAVPVAIDLDGSTATGTAHSFAVEGIDLDASVATGSAHRLRVETVFDPAPDVNSAADLIRFGAAHGLTAGQAVVYRDGGGVSIGGLSASATYYVILVDASTIGLAATQANALAIVPVFIDLDASVATGRAHSITPGATFDPFTDVDSGGDSVDLGYVHGFSTGQALLYSANGGTSVGGLTSGTTYYAIVVNLTTIRLAATRVDAEAPVPVFIDLNSATATGNAHSLRLDLDPTVATGAAHSVRGDGLYLRLDNGTIVRVSESEIASVTQLEAPTNMDTAGIYRVTDVEARGDVTVVATRTALHAYQVVSLAGDIALTLLDAAETGQDLVLVEGSALAAPQGAITLQVGDNLDGTANREFVAAGAVVIRGDYGNADPGVGVTVDLRAPLLASSVEVTTDNDDDGVNLETVPDGLRTTVRTYSGDDTIRVGRVASMGAGAGGSPSGVLLDGGAGDDVLRGSENGADTLIGGAGRDRILGFGGNDLIDGGSDDDILDGGAGDDVIEGAGGGDLVLGGANHDVIYGHSASGAGDDNAVDYLYGDFGTNADEPGSGRDRIYGQGGNDLLYGEGEDDFIDAGGGVSNLVNYGAGESAVPADFVPPLPTPAPVVGPPVAIPVPGPTLPGGADYRGWWMEFASSATGAGVSGGLGLSLEPSIAVSAGAQFIAWADKRDRDYEIYVLRHSAAGWQELAGSAHGGGVSGTAGHSRRPSLTLDAAGNPLVAWTEFNGTASDIFVARFDPAANGGAGGWVALGNSLGSGGISGTGAADHAVAVNVTSGANSGPVVAWLDRSGGVANVYVKRFNGTAWVEVGAGSAGGNGVSQSATSVRDLALTTDGAKLAVAWTQVVGTSTEIYLREDSGAGWAEPGSSATGGGVSNTTGFSQTPTLAYFGGALFVAWQDDTSGISEIYARRFTGGAWTAAGFEADVRGGVSNPDRAAVDRGASQPKLAAGGGRLELLWLDERRERKTGHFTVIYAKQWNGSQFVEELPGDARFHGISQTGGAALGLALAVDGAGQPFVAWADEASDVAEIFFRGNTFAVGTVYYVNDDSRACDGFTTALGNDANDGRTPATPKRTLQAVLNAYDLNPGDVILVDAGNYSGAVAIGAGDDGVLVLGTMGTVVAGGVTLSAGAVLQGLELRGGVTLAGSVNASLLHNVIRGGGVTISGGTGAHVVHNDIAAPGANVTLTGGTSGAVIEHNRITGGATGLAVNGAGAGGFELRDNRLSGAGTGIALSVAASGHIGDNVITATSVALDIAAPFSGLIERNELARSATGLVYGAAAALSANRSHDNTTGVHATVAGDVNGLGFVAGSTPNAIYFNATGVLLEGRMQNQRVFRNRVGVAGSGILGGETLDLANVIEHNATGTDFAGTIQFNRIGANGTSIRATDEQLIQHNLLYRHTDAGVLVSGRQDVRIIQNTFYTPSGDNVRVAGGAREVELLNNILWTQDGYDLDLDVLSRHGFWSDYNVLHASGAGKLVRFAKDFKDILDWQQDVQRYDLHSIGTTAVNPFWSAPRFFDRPFDDYRVFDLVAGQRFSSPTVDAGDPRVDHGLPPSYQNLLANGGFESGLTGWSVNTSAAVRSAAPEPREGANYFSAGHDALGWAEQTVDLLAAGFTTAQLDAEDFVAVFGGRVRSLAESVVDRGRILLSFRDGFGVQIGSAVVALAANTVDRWELVGDRTQLPAGTRSVQFRFETERETRPDNESFLDGTFLFVHADTVMPNQGAYGNTVAEDGEPARAHLALRFPDLYTDWELAARHTIRWDSFHNAAETTVRIDLFQDSPDGPQFLLNITEDTLDDGEFDWIPQNSPLPNGTYLTYGTHGLHVRLSFVGDNSVLDQSTERFSIPEDGENYYVDDGSNVDDEYTPLATGSNRHTGKRPTAPKPLLPTVLRLYDLGALSIAYVDNAKSVAGDESTGYLNFHQMVLSGVQALNDDEGLVVTGPAGAGTTTDFRYPFLDEYVVWFDVNDGDFVTLLHLTLTGGGRGVWVRHGSVNFTGRYLSISGATDEGVRLEADATNAVFEDSRVSGSGVGLYVGRPARLENNDVSGNGAGILAENGLSEPLVVGNGDLTLSRGNRVTGNAAYGISAVGNVLVFGNTVSGSPRGIILSGPAQASRNVVFGNTDGIYTDGAAGITENRVFNNSGDGVFVRGATPVHANVIYSNGTGLAAERFTGRMANNLVYANAAGGVVFRRSYLVKFVNNTVYEPAGNALTIEGDATGGSEDIELRNNVLWVTQGYAIAVASDSQLGLASNFNLLRATGAGRVARWQGVAYPTLLGWQNAAFTDQLSLSDDPLFVDADGADDVLGFAGGVDSGGDDDFHLQSTAGSFHGGSLAPVLGGGGLPVMPAAMMVMDAADSPGVDRGDAADAFGAEPAFNGGFINLGFEGNTAQASKSRSEFVLVLVPNGGEQWLTEHTHTILWRSHNFTGTVNVELWQTGGAAPVLTIASGTANDGAFDWTLPNSITANTNYRVRVQRNDATAKDDFSNQPFAILATLHFYYVNDATFLTGDWTTAAGSDANDGLTPATPKASVRAVLEAYDLDANDVIRVDNGTYVLPSNILVTANDSGVTIEGYFNASYPDRAAVLDRGLATASSFVIELQDADAVTLRDLKLTGGFAGVWAGDGSDSDNLTVTRVEFYGLDTGLYLGRGPGGTSSDNATITDSVFRNNRFGLRSQGAGTVVGSTTSLVSDVECTPLSTTGTGVFADGNQAYDNASLGIAVYGAGSLVGGNIVRDNAGIGIGVYGDGSIARANTVFGNVTGLDVRANAALVSGNTAHSNETGIAAQADILTTVTNNEVCANTVAGIAAVDAVRVEGNDVHWQSATPATVGIRLTGAAEAVNNRVSGNSLGLVALTGSTATANRVFNNSVGINATTTATVRSNFVYSNSTGLRADTGFSGAITGNLVYDNGSRGIELVGAVGATLVNNTVHHLSGAAVRVEGGSRDVRLRNNILFTGDGYDLSVAADSQDGFASDYNLMFATVNGALRVLWGDRTFTTRADWFYELGLDPHGLATNPLFVNPAGPDGFLGYVGGMDQGADDDFHLMSTAGSWHGGAFTADPVTSPGIDAGDPADAFASEPSSNGGRLNLGFEGNTAQASKSPSPLVQVLSPNGLEKFEENETVTIMVRTLGLPDGTTLTLELSTDNGMTWTTLTSTLAVDAGGMASYAWAATPVTETNRALIRATANTMAMPQDVSDAAFLIANNGTDYYVNDGDLTGDVFATAAGDNANSGKTAALPMASLAALLAAYNLDAGDVVRVDTGTYRLLRNTLIAAQDAGVRVEGPAGATALLDRRSTAAGSAVIELANANGVTVQRLSLTGGRFGIYAALPSDSDGVTLSDNTLYGHTEAGIFFDGDATVSSDSATLSGNLIFGDGTGTGQADGIRLNYSQAVTLSGNTVRDHARDGIFLTNATGTVSGGVVSGNAVGLLIEAGAGALTVSGVQVSTNADFGIRASGQVTLSGNTVSGQSRTGSVGIGATGGVVSGNTVFDNDEGIVATADAVVADNRVFHQSATGIRVDTTAAVRGNTVYSNRVGVRAEQFSGTITNNLIYANTGRGLELRGAAGASVVNNTIYQPAGDAVRSEGASRDVRLLNNILWVADGYAVSVAADSREGFGSDYNLLFSTGAGKLALWGDRAFTRRVDWLYELGHDAHGGTRDPLFVDADGADNLLGYTAGADHGLDDDFRLSASSPALDAGDPAGDFTLEPSPNGGRVDLGAYGNTAQATLRPAQTVQVLSPNGLEKFEEGQSVAILVRASGLSAGTTVTLEFSADDGATWSTVTSSLALDGAGRASFNWMVPAVAEADRALIRVTANAAPMPQDVSDEPFLVTNNGSNFYVNDSATVGDEFSTAPGDNANSGKRSDRPLASLHALLAAFDLDPGDVVHVDTGRYALLRNTLLDAQDAGVRIEGPSGAAAVLDRQDTGDGSAVIELVNADGVTIRRLTLTGGRYGVYAGPNSDSDDVTVSDNVIYGITGTTISFNAGLGAFSDRAIVSGNTIFNNLDAIWLEGDGDVVRGNQIYDNGGAAITVTGANAVVEANAVYGHVNGTGLVVIGELSTVSGNTVYGNLTGIEVVSTRQVAATGQRTTIRANTVFNNAGDGIRATGAVLIEGNLVYEHDEPGRTGIYAFSPEAEVRANVVHSNDQGIYAPGGATIVGNRVFNNAAAGIRSAGRSVIAGNVSYSNSVGVQGDFPFTGRIEANFIYANTNQGLFLRSLGAAIVNNTIYQLIGDAVRLQFGSRNVTLRNNILWAESGFDLYVTPDSQTGFSSDYNLLHQGADPNAHAGFWGGAIRDALADWQAASGQDAHSVAADPMFADLDGADNTLGWSPTDGGYDGGLDDNPYLCRNSPAIDRGDGNAGTFADLEGYLYVDDPGTPNLGTGAGYVDLGAFEFRGSSLDTTPPRVTMTTPADVSTGARVTPTLNEVVLHFSEALNPISARSLSLFSVIEAGPDAVFGAGVDRWVPIAALDYTPGGTVLRVLFAAPLGEGLYRLTINSAPTNSLYDLACNALDGDGNGSAAGHFTLTFLVDAGPELLSVTVNNGLRQRSLVTSLTLQFNKNVSASLTPADLMLDNLTTSATIAAADMAISFDAGTNRAVLTFPGLPNAQLPEGNYRLTVTGAGVTDIYGVPLPADFTFDFHVLTGDANGDRVVNDRDLYLVWQNLLKPAAQRNLNEDLTGDGLVTSADVNVVKDNYLATLPAPAPVPAASEPSVEPPLAENSGAAPTEQPVIAASATSSGSAASSQGAARPNVEHGEPQSAVPVPSEASEPAAPATTPASESVSRQTDTGSDESPARLSTQVSPRGSAELIAAPALWSLLRGLDDWRAAAAGTFRTTALALAAGPDDVGGVIPGNNARGGLLDLGEPSSEQAAPRLWRLSKALAVIERKVSRR